MSGKAALDAGRSSSFEIVLQRLILPTLSVNMNRTKAPSCGLKQVQQRDPQTVCQAFSSQVGLQKCLHLKPSNDSV